MVALMNGVRVTVLSWIIMLPTLVAVWPQCCLEVTGSCKTTCEQMSTAPRASSQDDRHKYVHVLEVYCPKTLVSFWKCINDTVYVKGQTEIFYGQPCCHLSQTDTCRLSCRKAQNRNDLAGGCRLSDEMEFYSCVDWQEAGDRCCLNANTKECHKVCKELFTSGQNQPTRSRNLAIENVCSASSPRVLDCVRNYTRPTPATANPQRDLHCCERSQNEQCTATCHRILRSNASSQEVVMDTLIQGGCGQPAIHDSLWQCFLSNSENSRPNSVTTSASRKVKMGRDAAKLHCCFKATTLGCQKHCYKTFGKEWESSWRNFHRLCLYQPAEAKMIRCLEEVDEPCELGCDGLSFCSEFNDRPTSMFRGCNTWSDQTAQNEVQMWRGGGYINTSFFSIPIADAGKCYPSMWKAIACVLAIKPCIGRQSFVSGLCWSDCVEILTKCLDYKRLAAGITPESICDMLLPTGHDTACTPLSLYLTGKTAASKPKEVTFPCRSNPCNASNVCIVNRDCHGGDLCSPYECVSGCRLGDASHTIVPRGSLVYIPTSSTNAGCYKVCRCSSKSTFEECVGFQCHSIGGCWIGGKRIAHKTTFQLDCNTCACYAGEVTCSNQVCSNVGDREVPGLTGLPCNCPDHYVPVCGANGRTYPSACVASCAGLTDRLMEFGACGTTDPCQPNPCKRGQRCFLVRDVCLSVTQKPCSKYECVDVNSECASGEESSVCDTNHVTHPSMCSLLRNDRSLAYQGVCLETCRNTGPVCGQNGEEFPTACAAWASRVYVDYYGACRSYGLVATDCVATKCEGVQCPPLPQGVRCHTVIPPGACCPICGSALKLLYSKVQMERIETVLAGRGQQLAVKEVVLAFRRHLKVAECDAFGYLGVDGDLVLVVTTSVTLTTPPTSIQLDVCVREADKLSSMIQLQTPAFLSDFMLSAIAAVEAVHVHVGAALALRPSSSLVTWTLMLSLLFLIISLK